MKQLPVIDLHQDLLTHINDRVYFGNHWQTDFDRICDAGFRAVVATAFPVPPHEDWFHPTANDLIEKDLLDYADRCATDDRYALICNSSDLEHIQSDVTGIIMHIEGLNVFNGTQADWQRLERWYALGLRSMGIVWNVSNELGGGTNDSEKGLTRLGSDVIDWLQEKKMIVDCAHMNRPTFNDAVKHIKHPLYISHGNCSELCPSPRNYDDEQLRLIADSAGVCGIFLAKSYVTGKQAKRATINDVCDHIDHMKHVMGIDHIALGTDFGGIISGFVNDLDELSCLHLLWDALLRRHYSQEDCEKIAWKNAYRVLTAIL